MLLRRPHDAVPDRPEPQPGGDDQPVGDAVDGAAGESNATPADPAPRHTIEAD